MLRTHFDESDAISLQDFQDAVEKQVDPDDPRSMMKVGREIVKLANNPHLLADGFSKQLGLWKRGLFTLYSPQSAVLSSFGRFHVRVNFWPKLPSDPRRRTILARLLSYDRYHDHNFSFLTTNFFGPGYETELFSYDYDEVEGFLGEKVELNYEGRFKLERGNVFLFQQGIDIHSQVPPGEISGSINLMVKSARGAVPEEQYEFDVERGRLSGYVDSIVRKQSSLMGFCREFGDSETVRVVESLALSHPSKSMRATACQALAVLAPRVEVRDSVLQRAKTDDESRLVRESAERALDRC